MMLTFFRGRGHLNCFHISKTISTKWCWISMVQESRRQERKRGIAHAKMYEFNNMEKLSSYLMSI